MKRGAVFLEARGVLLGEHGYDPDPGDVAYTPTGIVFYHYSRRERLAQILAEGSGLWARLPVVCPAPPPEFVGCNLIEGFLEPLPKWLADSPYFGTLGLEMVKDYLGRALLRIEVPRDFPGLYVADYAHNLECKHIERRGRPALGLGYDCRTGHEATQAYVHSYTPMGKYKGGHVAPVVQAVREGEGIAIPSEYITIADAQPLAT